jgi:hypothetical protein
MLRDPTALPHVLAAAPFLPPGEGAQILMLGGLAMLAVAGLAGRFAPVPSSYDAVPSAARGQRRRAAGERPPRPARRSLAPERAPDHGMTAASPDPDRGMTAWVDGLGARAAELGLGKGRFLQANERQCVFFLSGCKTCRTRRPGTHGCEATRRSIERLVLKDAPRAKVKETACGAISHGACTFEIRRTR